MSMKQALVWTCPGWFSMDMEHARGMAFLRRKIMLRMAAIVVD
jgi:hypothetical protein